jgi:hypothetical protein
VHGRVIHPGKVQQQTGEGSVTKWLVQGFRLDFDRAICGVGQGIFGAHGSVPAAKLPPGMAAPHHVAALPVLRPVS